MNEKARRGQPPLIATGITSLVLVFVLLCLLTFAVLSLVSAQADLRLSQKSAARTTAYYAAENAANDLLLALIPVLDANAGAPDAESYYAAVQAGAADMESLAFDGQGRVSFQVPLGEQQILAVELELLHRPAADGAHYRILRWQAVTGYDWQQEQPLELIRPGTLPEP